MHASGQLTVVLSTSSLNILNLPVKMTKSTTKTAKAIAAIIIVLIEILWDFLSIINPLKDLIFKYCHYLWQQHPFVGVSENLPAMKVPEFCRWHSDCNKSAALGRFKLEHFCMQVSVSWTPFVKPPSLPVKIANKTTKTASAMAAIIIVLIEMLCPLLLMLTSFDTKLLLGKLYINIWVLNKINL